MDKIDPNAFLNRAVPGQSLTNDPESPRAFEKPPKHTNLRKAQEEIFNKLTQEQTYMPLMELLDSGEATIMDATQSLLFSGFKAGQWNPDMMLMLAEPVAFMMMALAERAGVDYEVDKEQDEEVNPEDRFKETIKTKKPVKGAIPKEIQDKIDQIPEESLMAKPSAPEESLIEKPNG